MWMSVEAGTVKIEKKVEPANVAVASLDMSKNEGSGETTGRTKRDEARFKKGDKTPTRSDAAAPDDPEGRGRPTPPLGRAGTTCDGAVEEEAPGALSDGVSETARGEDAVGGGGGRIMSGDGCGVMVGVGTLDETGWR